VFSKRAEHPFVKRIVIVKMIAAYPEPASFERVALDVITAVIIFWSQRSADARVPSMSTTTKLRQIGNSDGLTFRAEQLREAGFVRGDEIVVEAQPGRIVLSKADSAYAKAMEALDACLARYDATLRRLAR
jgi:antitoxin component of MazEF toxin-antitoxin module